MFYTHKMAVFLYVVLEASTRDCVQKKKKKKRKKRTGDKAKLLSSVDHSF